MSTSVSGILSPQPPKASGAIPAPASPASVARPPVDTVSVSQSAEVSQLNLQGLSPSQIAESLSIPLSSVNLDLGIVAATSGTVTAPAAPLAASASAG